ncbi:uncharacterized protein YALI1_A11568g [Yarrowia lipolytica]|uniref:Uncharacterized protein n=1 Tax=Yarrowia lipolytica TaxID=4952 RepID=A0A1D8N4H6_YARLL|nr:hypothetical protein YALI1_A11568g [Yarrowia lipolytica]
MTPRSSGTFCVQDHRVQPVRFPESARTWELTCPTKSTGSEEAQQSSKGIVETLDAAVKQYLETIQPKTMTSQPISDPSHFASNGCTFD